MGNELAVSVLDLVGMRAGEPAGSAIARSVDLAQHVEQLGIQALLAGGTSLHFWTGLLRDAGADWACGGSDKDDSRGQRRSDAAEPCTAGGGGTVWDAGSAVSGTNRSGAGTRSGRRLSNDAGAAKGFAAEWRRFSGAAGGTADLPGAGEAGANGESDSRTGKQCADHVAGVERLQRATGGDAGVAVCIRGALCS